LAGREAKIPVCRESGVAFARKRGFEDIELILPAEGVYVTKICSRLTFKAT
jgi:hypothetical protein